MGVVLRLIVSHNRLIVSQTLGRVMPIPGDTRGVWYEGGKELWTTSYCAIQGHYTTVSGRASVDKFLRRKNIVPYTRLHGRSGENLWDAELVKKTFQEKGMN